MIYAKMSFACMRQTQRVALTAAILGRGTFSAMRHRSDAPGAFARRPWVAQGFAVARLIPKGPKP